MITTDDMRTIALFAEMPESELRTIASRAADVRLRRGDWVVQEGETPAFFAVLEGKLDVLKLLGNDEQIVATWDRGQHFGELSLLVASSSVASFRAAEDSRIMRLDRGDFQELIVACMKLRERIVGSIAANVQRLLDVAVRTPAFVVTIVGDRWDLACHDVRDFLQRNRVEYDWVDREDDPGFHEGARYPSVILPDGTRLENPTYRELSTRVGLSSQPQSDEYDVVIVGGGPAGLGAAVYGASEGLHTLLVERIAPGGQAGTSSRIENYLGFASGVTGDELSRVALRQAKGFGAEIVVARRVKSLEPAAPGSAHATHAITLDGGDVVRARSVVLATGLSWRRLDVPGAARLSGRGVYYGAARTERISVQGQNVVLVGGGNSAGQAAMLFCSYAARVTIVIRNHAIEETMSQYLVDQIGTKENIFVETESDISALEGEDHLTAVVVQKRDAPPRTYAADALFVFIGATAETDWLPPSIARDSDGYVCTGRDMLDLESDPAMPRWPLERDPYLLETSIPGIFAVGDVRHASVKRVASAVGEGSMAIAFVHRALERDVPGPLIASH